MYVLDSVLNIKVDYERARIEQEKKFYWNILNIYLPPHRGGSMGETHLIKISNYLIENRHMYARPVRIGRFLYIKFSGLWDSLLVKDGSIMLRGDTIYVRFYIPRDMDYIRLAKWNLNVVKNSMLIMAAGVGFEDAHHEIKGKEKYMMSFPLVIRRDVSIDRIRHRILGIYALLSDSTLNDSTFLNVDMGSRTFDYTIISLGIETEEEIYTYGRLNILSVD